MTSTNLPLPSIRNTADSWKFSLPIGQLNSNGLIPHETPVLGRAQENRGSTRTTNSPLRQLFPSRNELLRGVNATFGLANFTVDAPDALLAPWVADA